MDSLQPLLTLLRLPHLGAFTYQRLHRHFGSADAIWQASDDALKPLISAKTHAALQQLRSCDQHPLLQQVHRELDWLAENPEVTTITLDSPAYPALLATIDGAPPLLYVRGNVDALELPQLAIVGSRNPTAGGRDNAHEFARYLAVGGFAITSGLALGIDAAAHAGALDGGGVTLAVMGTGIDKIYPARNRLLAEDIVAQGGALISEFAPGTTPIAANFPRRNRIISGLSLGTLVVEAAVQSGSLITARSALEQQRDVFVIPGSIHNPLARGAHLLIKQGAFLVETAADIVGQLGAALAFKHSQMSMAAGPAITCSNEEKKLLKAMGYDPVTLDTLAQRTGFEVSALTAVLTNLEMSGAVIKQGAIYTRYGTVK
ncbi:MAG TPA: DNA-processing protein DprA [Cellvibrionaceae bacterium]